MIFRALKKIVLSVAEAIGAENFLRNNFRRIMVIRNAPEILDSLVQLRTANEQLVASIRSLEERTRFLYFEVSDLRSLSRHLIAKGIDLLPEIAHTYESFDYQWENIPAGRDLLSDPQFKQSVKELISRYTGLDGQWFNGKKVLDAGCGNGRFTFGLAHLGAQVVAVDQSIHGITYALNSIKSDPSIPGSAEFQQRDLLSSLEMHGQFDLAWSFGVLHHTGNTYLAFKNVVDTIKPGGYLFMMIYGEPEWDNTSQFEELNTYWSWRRKLRSLPPSDRFSVLKKHYGANSDLVHGMFDAVSPLINDLYTESELRSWLRSHGFVDIRRTVDNRNIFLIAKYQGINPASRN